MKVGDTVSVGIDARISVITEEFAHGDETLFHAHYVDLMTGEKLRCPDKRCHGEHTCPIHGRNIRATDARIVSQSDIDKLRTFGIHCAPVRCGHTWGKDGFCVYCHKVHRTDHNARSTCSDGYGCRKKHRKETKCQT